MKKALVDIKTAVAIRKLAEGINAPGNTTTLGFTCPECKEPLSVHINPQADHFEHLPDGPPCSLREK
jgi:hypothetical protein